MCVRSTADLATLIARHLNQPGMAVTALPCLSLFRTRVPTAPLPTLYEASVCLIAQGSKRVALGGEVVPFDAAHHLVVSVDLPLVGHVIPASAEAPYLCCKIDFDLRALADLVLADGEHAAAGRRRCWPRVRPTRS